MNDDLHIDRSNTLAIHASAAHADGGAVIFLGPSGTGKTTICQMLEAHAEPLAYDAVYLVLGADREWRVVKGDGHAHYRPLPRQETVEAHSAPLRGIIRLHQAAEPRLERIDELNTCRYLTDAFFEIVKQREYDLATKQCAFSNLAAVARCISGYRLHFDLSPRTVEMLRTNILAADPAQMRPAGESLPGEESNL